MIESIAPGTIAQIAAHLFGEDTQVASVRKLTTTREHGITKVAESTRNLLYMVRLEGLPQAFIFRFDRTEGKDVYEQEVRNYSLLAEQAGVRVPTVYGIDRSKRLAPTAYMVMEYLTGDSWQYLSHPDNPETPPQEKEGIRYQVGQLYAQVHGVTRKAAQPDAEAQTVLHTMDRLEEAARRGVVDVDSGDLDRSRRAAMQEPSFNTNILSLCLIDAEIHLRKEDAGWNIAFVCDAEWVGFRHPYADLTLRLARNPAWWRRDRPLATTDPAQLAERPFFRGYEAMQPVDHEKLLHLSPFYELSRWAYLATESNSPEKKRWIKACKEPLIRELVRHIAARV